MKILFVLANYMENRDANINIANIIIDCLKENHEVSVIGCVHEKKLIRSVNINNVNIYNVFLKKREYILKAYEQYEKKKHTYKSKFQAILHCPISSVIIFLHRYTWFLNESLIYIKKIDSIIKTNNFNAIVGVSNPFYTVFSISKIKIKIKKIGIFLDPYSYYEKVKDENFNNALKREIGVYKKLDSVFVVDYIYDSYTKSNLKSILPLMTSFKLPSIRKIEYTNLNNNILFNKEKINCIYVGGLYEDIRSPQYLFDTFLKLNDNFVLYLIGSGAENIVNKYKMVLKSRLIICGKVQKEIAFNAMLSADILINIGNTVENQIPSKIIDYISVGKPIINLYKIENCKTLLYTRKYPICLNFKEDYSKIDNFAEIFSKFCISNKGKEIKFEMIRNLYEENTPNHLVNKIIESIERK